MTSTTHCSPLLCLNMPPCPVLLLDQFKIHCHEVSNHVLSLFREVLHIVIDVPELDINRHCPSDGVLVLLKDDNEDIVVDVMKV